MLPLSECCECPSQTIYPLTRSTSLTESGPTPQSRRDLPPDAYGVYMEDHPGDVDCSCRFLDRLGASVIDSSHLQLLDDDDAVIGRLHSDCSFAHGRPVPALPPGRGDDYLDLEKLPSDELLEVIGKWFRTYGR